MNICVCYIQRALLYSIWVNICGCLLPIYQYIDRYSHKKQSLFLVSSYFPSLVFPHVLIRYNTYHLEALWSKTIDFIVIDLSSMTEWYLCSVAPIPLQPPRLYSHIFNNGSYLWESETVLYPPLCSTWPAPSFSRQQDEVFKISHLISVLPIQKAFVITSVEFPSYVKLSHFLGRS